jgi:hypothetical protein
VSGPTFWDPSVISVIPGFNATVGIGSANAPLFGGTTSFLGADQPFAPWPDEVSPWERITFNGVRAPGICEVTGGKRKRLDHRMTPGASGASTTVLGYDLAEFIVSLKLWTPSQWAAFLKLVPILHATPAVQQPPPQPFLVGGRNVPLGLYQPPTPPNPALAPVAPQGQQGAGPQGSTHAVKVDHPAFACIGVYDIVVSDIQVPQHIGNQIMIVIIDCVELRAPLNEGPQSATVDIRLNPDGSFSSVGGRPAPPTPATTSLGPNG